jgi:hypothetical protein
VEVGCYLEEVSGDVEAAAGAEEAGAPVKASGSPSEELERRGGFRRPALSTTTGDPRPGLR